MKIKKYLISKFLIFGLLILIAIPNVAEAEGFKIGQAGKYRSKWWGYVGVGELGVSFPSKSSYIRLIPFAIGFAPPIGLGIGSAIAEAAGPFKGNYWAVTLLPLYIYWVPYVKWNEDDAQSIIYTFLGVSGWANPKDSTIFGESNYLRYGIGLSYNFGGTGLGVETGFISYKEDDSTSYNSLYIGFNLPLSIWFGSGTKEIHPSPGTSKPRVIAHNPKYPANLIISHIKFSEPSGNRALDGYETGKLKFTIQNQGKGEAVGVKVRLVRLLGGSKLSYKRENEIGAISPNSSKSVEIPIYAPYDVPSEKVKFRVEITEKYGNDADPFVFSFETKRYEPPKLIIADVGIDDDKEGDSQGNNNGIIEPGEAIEVTVGVQNTGIGNAEDVKAKMIIGNQNVHYMGKKQYNLGDIASGDYKTFGFYFWIPKRYGEDKVPITVSLTEAKGRYGSEKTLNLPVGKPSGYVKEIKIAKKEIQRTQRAKRVELSIDVDKIPQNSLTKLKDGIAVIIGIEEYKNAPKATFANRDATIFYEYVKSVFGIPERNIYIRTNEEATKGEFDKIFGEGGWLSRRIIKGKSDVIVYFSGHGAPSIKTHEPYIVPYDGDPNYVEQTAYPLDYVYKSLNRLGAKSVTVFLDACFSGGSRTGEMLLAESRPFIPVKIPKIEQNITVFSATAEEQISSSYREKKHGLFTYYLLKGLQGFADLNKDKIIKVGELADYIRENVQRQARYMDREQTPKLIGVGKERVLVRLK